MQKKQNEEKALAEQDPLNQIEEYIPQSHQHSSFFDQNKYYLLLLFVFLAILIFGYKIRTQTLSLSSSAEIYDSSLVKLQIDDFRKLNDEQLLQEGMLKTVGKGINQISRQQLGHNSWTLLHMITGSFPPRIDQNLRQRFNTFLILFGQFYPCKLCANHFMQLIKAQGLFEGETKLELMTYLCNLHNKVNKRLGKPEHSCQNIVQQWNTCGCSQAE